MHFSSRFFKAVAVCAFCYGSLLIIMGLFTFIYGNITSADAEYIIPIESPDIYQEQLWLTINIVLTFLFIVTMWGIAAKKFNVSAGLVTTGFIFALCAFLFQLTAYSTMLYGGPVRVMSRFGYQQYNHIQVFYDMAEGLLMNSAICIAILIILYGLAFWFGSGKEKIIGILLFSRVALVILSTFPILIGQDWLLYVIFFCSNIIIFPATIFYVGAWLLEKKETA